MHAHPPDLRRSASIPRDQPSGKCVAMGAANRDTCSILQRGKSRQPASQSEDNAGLWMTAYIMHRGWGLPERSPRVMTLPMPSLKNKLIEVANYRIIPVGWWGHRPSEPSHDFHETPLQNKMRHLPAVGRLGCLRSQTPPADPDVRD